MKDFSHLNRSAYDQVATQFAQANANMSPNLQQAAERLLARLEPYSRLLDVGCGAGRDLAWMQDNLLASQPACLYGTDLSFGMLREAYKIARAVFSQADMRALPFAAGSFGAVWSIAALLHLPRAAAPVALAEMARVLSPNGWLHISVQKGSGEGLEKSPYEPPVERFFSRFQPDEFTELLQQAGFRIVDLGEELGHRHWLWAEAQKEKK